MCACACVRGSVYVCVRACVRGCVFACVRRRTYVFGSCINSALHYIATVKLGSEGPYRKGNGFKLQCLIVYFLVNSIQSGINFVRPMKSL